MPNDRRRAPRNRWADGPALTTLAGSALLAILVAGPAGGFAWDLFGPPAGLLLFAAVVAFAGWRAWKRIRTRAVRWQALRGQCVRCGYDLRQSSARCLECGEPTPTRETGRVSPHSHEASCVRRDD